MDEPLRETIAADALPDREIVSEADWDGIPDFGITFPTPRPRRFSIAIWVAVATALALILWGTWPQIQRLQIDRRVSIGLLALIYILPTVIATLRLHSSLASIAAVNLFLGWTVVGWIVALGRSLSRRRLRTERYHDFNPPEVVVVPTETIVIQAVLPDRQGWIYMLQAGTWFKIGRAKKLDRRIYQLKIQLPFEAQLVHAIQTDDTHHAERHWHERFRARRLNGEWFELTGSDVREFRRYEYHEIRENNRFR